MPFQIEYTPEAVTNIEALRAFDQRRILDGINRHLTRGDFIECVEEMRCEDRYEAKMDREAEPKPKNPPS